MTLSADVGSVRRSLLEVEHALRSLGRHPVDRRLLARLENDLRRVREDLDDLSYSVSAQSGGAPADEASTDLTPVPVPPREGPEFDPDCDDEGLAGTRLEAPVGQPPAVARPGRLGRRR